MMISCKQAAELVCQGLDRPLSLWERTRLRLHLFMCAGCKNFQKQSEALDRLLKKRFHEMGKADDLDAELAGMPEEVCDRLKQKLREAINKENAPPADGG